MLKVLKTISSFPFLNYGMVFLLIPFMTSAQVGVNTTDIDFSAILQVESTNKGVLFPRLTIKQRDDINKTASGAGETVPAGLTIFCIDCCTNGTGSLYYYNGVDWKPLDSSCRDLYAPPECLDVDITVSSTHHLINNSKPLFIDGEVLLASQDNSDILRLHKKSPTEFVDFKFPEELPIGYKIRLYYNDKSDNIGIEATMKLGVNETGQKANTINSLPAGSTITNLGGDDYYLEMVLNAPTDGVYVSSANNEDHIYLLEIKLFDSFGVEIKLNCN